MTITQERNLYIAAEDDILNVNVKNPYLVPLTTRNYLWQKAAMLGSGVSASLATPGDGGDDGGQQGYTYSITFYFDETWPYPNYYLTIYFNITAGGGPITSVNYTMGNWGYYISGSFTTDPNSYINFWGNSIVFNVTGTQNAPISLFGTSAGTNTSIINISGWVQTTTNGGVTGGQATLQPKGPYNP